MSSFRLCATSILFFAVGACSNTVQPTSFTAPNGQQVLTSRCNQTPAQCYAQAAQACSGGPYQVVESYSNPGGLLADALPGPVTWFTMSFQCGPSDGQLPQFPLREAPINTSLVLLYD